MNQGFIAPTLPQNVPHLLEYLSWAMDREGCSRRWLQSPIFQKTFEPLGDFTKVRLSRHLL